MSTYKSDYPYKKLPDGETFRYLSLQPGVGDEPLIASLHTANILDIEYDAVSYAWGTSMKDHTILCEGYTMMITPNLSTVLHRVRLHDRPMAVWADGICINQQDVNEKGHQVALMGMIYRSAARVLIYIGSDDGSKAPSLCSLLDKVDHMVQATCKTIDMSWDSFPDPDADDPLLFDYQWDALYTLISQSWLDRGWVVQEAALARCGEVIWVQSSFGWDKLMRVYVWLATRGTSIYYDKRFSAIQINAHTEVYLEGHQDFARAFYSKLSWGTPSLLKTLNCAKELDFGNPSDRIYAFMELPQRVTVRPNYYASHLDAYKRFAIEFIRSTKSTELLDYVSHDDESLESNPSWVPRWDIPNWSLAQALSASSVLKSRLLSSSQSFITEHDSLEVRGVILDTVHYASELFDWDTTTGETIHQVWQDVNAAQIQTPYSTPDSTVSHLRDAFFDALSGGAYDGEYSQWRQAREAFASEAHIKGQSHVESDWLSDSADAGAEGATNIFYDLVRSKTHRRRFILTDRGYMGLAPLSTRGGDLVGIVFGCKTPCMLRKTGQGKHHMYLGAATVMGKECFDVQGTGVMYCTVLGEEESKDWMDWDVKEEDIWLC
ncbi:heterokaryon incompatibility protein-domain-containing protein [Ampelomyces quisqualis]|uniref:Heterokaryon incompatibility protein-domain-containing protein n=1 Tax=Ampelomyces quisqualis TaxID=50730 RepID=A0A6A5R0S3_AMPQU|nr:heterokaryon incompatibility protein-domain-containing protein [Ampelomyces quisqualis]